MYISYNWLKNYLPNLDKVDIKDLSHKISGALAEVEQVIEKGRGLEGVVAGEIKEVYPHPQSKSLMIAKVNTGDKIRQIVFAGEDKQYVKTGSLYPVCLPQGKIYKKQVYSKSSQSELMLIEKRELKGIMSEGMLCSPKELGVSDEHRGISIVGNDMNPGDNLIPLLHDFIFEIENKSLTHRSDCFSHRGIAREISAIMQIDYLEKGNAELPIKAGDKLIKISVLERNLCQRFTGITLQDVSVRPSPTWMQIFLSYVGTRPINNIVDISNFLMLDIGYPIHMYDYDKLVNHELIVRRADLNENVQALNEKSYKLDNEMVVVADKDRIQDIAGIMGGADSEVTSETKNVVIESACWDMYNIRRTMMTLGITSEAGIRFSKGLSPEGTKETVIRAAKFVEELANGETASEIIDIQNTPQDEKYLEFNTNNIKRLLGVDIEKKDIINILKSLQIETLKKENSSANISEETISTNIQLKIPYFRRDLNIPQDIVEEIARIYGYVNIKPELPLRNIKSVKINTDSKIVNRIKHTLCESGLDEVFTYSFIGSELYSKSNLDINSTLKLKNPLSPELEYYRNYILPSLIDKIGLNMNINDKIGYFEISKVPDKTKLEEDIPVQDRQIAGIQAQKENSEDIYYSLKQKLDYLFEKFNLKVDYHPLDSKEKNEIQSLFHPSKSASIIINGNPLGFVGVLHPIVQNNFEYSQFSIAIFQLDYKILKSAIENAQFEYKTIIYTQKVVRDFSFWMKQKTELANVLKKINTRSIKYLSDIELIDIYTDEEEKRGVTLRFTLQDPTRTLEQKEIESTLKQILDTLQEEKDLELRTK